MKRYIDGFVLPIPKQLVSKYQAIAEAASKLWKEHGALDTRVLCVNLDEGSKRLPHLSMMAITSFCAVLGIAIVGCGDAPVPQPSAHAPARMEGLNAKDPENGKDGSQTYVNCSARFTTLDKEYPWHEDSSVGHDDGKAPLASFVLVEPASCADRDIGIIFKYTADADTTVVPDQKDIGSQFEFQIPAEFLSSDYTIIDNTLVRHLRRVEP